MLVTAEAMEKFPAALPHRLDPERHWGRNKTLYVVMRRFESFFRFKLKRTSFMTNLTDTKNYGRNFQDRSLGLVYVSFYASVV